MELREWISISIPERSDLSAFDQSSYIPHSDMKEQELLGHESHQHAQGAHQRSFLPQDLSSRYSELDT